MKKLKALFFLMVLAVSVHAQTNHITFLGIPLNSDYLIFDNKLKGNGYEIVGYNDSYGKEEIIYEGGTFHDKKYSVTVTCSENKVSSIFLSLDSLDYESAITEMAELRFGTETKHKNYKSKNYPKQPDVGLECLIEFTISDNPYEQLLYALYLREDGNYAIRLLWDCKKKTISNNIDDL